jgi:hypothetical protein
MHFNVKLSGLPSGREPQKNLLVIADEESPVIRFHIANEAGTSLASIALDDDQILLLGTWLINISSGGDRSDPTLTQTLESGRFTATRECEDDCGIDPETDDWSDAHYCGECGMNHAFPGQHPRRKTVEGCPMCEQIGTGFGPSHDASPRCESGKRPHCTCSTCF